MIRLFIAETTPPFAAGLRIALNPDQGRYLSTVMRLGVGDEVSVFNGRDGEWTARLAEVTKKVVVLELAAQLRPQPIPSGPGLAVALIKRAPLEYIVEKGTELGASRIQLLITRRSNAGHTNVERLIAIARESAEQTERLDVPEILSPVKLDQWLQNPPARLIFADEESAHERARVTQPILQALTGSAAGDDVLLIGPEGGFDDGERQALRALPNAVPVNLGPRILRADTAAISGLTLYQAAIGDWR